MRRRPKAELATNGYMADIGTEAAAISGLATNERLPPRSLEPGWRPEAGAEDRNASTKGA